jgi:hypothetical protein
MNRRDLLAALGAVGGLAVMSREDESLFGPIVVDSDETTEEDTDTTDEQMTLDVTVLDEVHSEAGTKRIDPGESTPILVGDLEVAHEVLGFALIRLSDQSTLTLSEVYVRDGDDDRWDITSNQVGEFICPVGINPVERIVLTADPNNAGTEDWEYHVLYR